MRTKHKTANQIVREHYRLNRPATDEEVRLEIENLERKWYKGNLDDNAQLLLSSLTIYGHMPDLRFSTSKP